MNNELRQALDLIRELTDALSKSDPNSQDVNRRILQRASEFLDKHNWLEPKFEG